jgi:hypothetical protein
MFLTDLKKDHGITGEQVAKNCGFLSIRLVRSPSFSPVALAKKFDTAMNIALAEVTIRI